MEVPRERAGQGPRRSQVPMGLLLGSDEQALGRVTKILVAPKGDGDCWKVREMQGMVLNNRQRTCRRRWGWLLEQRASRSPKAGSGSVRNRVGFWISFSIRHGVQSTGSLGIRSPVPSSHSLTSHTYPFQPGLLSQRLLWRVPISVSNWATYNRLPRRALIFETHPPRDSSVSSEDLQNCIWLSMLGNSEFSFSWWIGSNPAIGSNCFRAQNYHSVTSDQVSLLIQKRITSVAIVSSYPRHRDSRTGLDFWFRSILCILWRSDREQMSIGLNPLQLVRWLCPEFKPRYSGIVPDSQASSQCQKWLPPKVRRRGWTKPLVEFSADWRSLRLLL